MVTARYITCLFFYVVPIAIQAFVETLNKPEGTEVGSQSTQSIRYCSSFLLCSSVSILESIWHKVCYIGDNLWKCRKGQTIIWENLIISTENRLFCRTWPSSPRWRQACVRVALTHIPLVHDTFPAHFHKFALNFGRADVFRDPNQIA